MRTICVVTGSRAEYGLLKWLMAGIRDSSQSHLQVIATGMHLSPEFGSTWRVIEADGFPIDRKVEMLLSSDTAVGVTKSMGLALSGFADAFASLRPDIVVVLGDRFEIHAAVTAALIAGLPVAHLHGGELTMGAFDDAIRHAITKMSVLHFTGTEPYRRRVIQMGEAPERVFNVGGFGIDAISRVPRMDRAELERSIGFELGDTNLLVTFHPETATGASSAEQVDELLAALDGVDARLVFTMPNADTDGRAIVARLTDYVQAHPERACVHTSLGQTRYLSLMELVDGVVGNSSSGLAEAPSFGIGTVNIGARQDGRLRASSVVDCEPERAAIRSAVQRILSPKFRAAAKSAVNPYGSPGAAERTLAVLERFELDSGPKGFFDIPLSDSLAGL